MPLVLNWASPIPAAAATRLRVLTWLLPLKTMPLRLTMSTVPSALIWPWICEGRAFGSLTRLRTAQSFCCLNSTVVLRPTLKVSQFRMALSPVCAMAMLLRPSTWVSSGALALCQPAVSELVSIFRPPALMPSGTDAPFAAARRAAAWADCCAAMPRAARFRLLIERCSCSLAFCCCPSGFVRLDAGWPPGSLPVCDAVSRTAPLSANHAGLNVRCAWAGSVTAPATSVSAMARANGASLNTRSCLRIV